MSDTQSLYEDSAVWVVNKPAGMPCTRKKDGRWSVADVVTKLLPTLCGVGSAQDCGITHRLDNGTSGCLIVAKTPEAYAALRRQFEANTIYKGYQAVAIGHPPATGYCDAPIIHDPKSAKRMRCARTGETGQSAHTEWTVLRNYPISPLGPAGYVHMQIRITTGVRHQIRLHMAQLGHPLVGDTTYQSRTQRCCDRLGLLHPLLHAHRIEFLSPATRHRVTCEAPLLSDFAHILKTLDETKKRR